MSAPIGGIPAPITIDTSRNTVYDVWSWGQGARPLEVDATSTIDTVLESILADMRTRRLTDSSTFIIKFRPGTWQAKYPAWIDVDGVIIEGLERKNTKIQNYSGYACPIFLFGLNRVPVDGQGNNVYIDPSHWTDAFGKLDTSAASAAGQKWGVTVDSTAWITSWSSGFTAGALDRWVTLNSLTIDFCLDPGTGNAIASGNFCGLVDSLNQANPIYLSFSANGVLKVDFRTQDAAKKISSRSFTVTLPHTGLQKIAVQFSIETGEIAAFSNGTQIAVTAGSGTGSGGPAWPAPGSTFLENFSSPFHIGLKNNATGKAGTLVSRTIYGLRFDSALRYANSGVNQSQARRDGGALNDSYRYFFNGYTGGPTGTCLALLALTDPPRGNAACIYDGRLVSIQPMDRTGIGTTFGLWFPTQQITNVTNDILVRTLKVQNTFTNRYADASTIGEVTDFRINDAEFAGGWRGLGDLNMVTSYMIRADDYRVTGKDCGWYAWKQIIKSTGLDTGNIPGNYALRLVACNADIQDTVFAGGPAEVYIQILEGGYGGPYKIHQLLADNEGTNYPSRALISIELNSGTPVSIDISNIHAGDIGPDGCLIEFLPRHNQSANYQPAHATIKDLSTWADDFDCFIRVSDDKLTGRVEAPFTVGFTPYRVPIVKSLAADGRHGLHVYSRDFIGPPRDGSYTTGMHEIEARGPVAGQFTKLVCLRGGNTGTESRPVWGGLDPCIVDGTEIAAYIDDGVAISGTLSVA